MVGKWTTKSCANGKDDGHVFCQESLARFTNSVYFRNCECDCHNTTNKTEFSGDIPW